MPNPKRRHTRARRDKRRASNFKLAEVSVSKCKNCGKIRQPHTVCPHCGFYRDRIVVAVKDKSVKKEESDK